LFNSLPRTSFGVLKYATSSVHKLQVRSTNAVLYITCTSIVWHRSGSWLHIYITQLWKVSRDVPTYKSSVSLRLFLRPQQLAAAPEKGDVALVVS